MILHLLLKGKIRLFIFIKIKETLFTRHLNTILIWLHLKIYSTIVCSQSNVTSKCWTRLQTSSALLCITLLHHICCAMFLWLTFNPRLLSISPCIISFQTAFTGPSPPSGTIPALKGNWLDSCWALLTGQKWCSIIAFWRYLCRMKHRSQWRYNHVFPTLIVWPPAASSRKALDGGNLQQLIWSNFHVTWTFGL